MRSLTICARFFNKVTHEFHVLLIEWNISRLQNTDIWRVVGDLHKLIDSIFAMFFPCAVYLHSIMIVYSQCSTAVVLKWRLWSYTLNLNCWPHCVIHRSYYFGTVSMIYFRSNFCSGVKIHFSCIHLSAGFVSTQLCERLTPKWLEYYYLTFWKIMFSIFVNSSDLKSILNISQ